ncbi:hypothetical protein T08_3995 [Trichinella sp. T8]|nr:hypothetical protein T08_3995 [Trichinella sp. T8]
MAIQKIAQHTEYNHSRKFPKSKPEHLNIQGDAVFVNRTEPILSLLEKFIANLKKNGNQIGDYSVDPMTIAFNGEKISSELRQTMSEFKEPEEKPLLPTYVIVIIACVLAIAALLTLAVLVKRRSGSEVLNKSIKNGSAVKAWAEKAMLKMQPLSFSENFISSNIANQLLNMQPELEMFRSQSDAKHTEHPPVATEFHNERSNLAKQHQAQEINEPTTTTIPQFNQVTVNSILKFETAQSNHQDQDDTTDDNENRKIIEDSPNLHEILQQLDDQRKIENIHNEHPVPNDNEQSEEDSEDSASNSNETTAEPTIQSTIFNEDIKTEDKNSNPPQPAISEISLALPTAVHIKFGNDDLTSFNNEYDESVQNTSTTHKSEDTQYDENSQNPTSVKEPIPSMEPGNKEAENKMEMENSAPVEDEFLLPLNATIKENIPSIYEPEEEQKSHPVNPNMESFYFSGEHFDNEQQSPPLPLPNDDQEQKQTPIDENHFKNIQDHLVKDENEKIENGSAHFQIPFESTTQISQNGETNIQLQPESIPTEDKSVADADSDKQFSVAVNEQNITTIEENYAHLNETHVETLPEENANLPNEEQQTQQETFASDEELFHEKPKIIQTHTVDDNPLQEEKEENMTEETTTTIIAATTIQLENDMQSDEEKEAILEGNIQTNATYESEQFFNLTEYETTTVVQDVTNIPEPSNAENEQHIQESNTKMTNIPESTLVGVTETVDDAQMTAESNESPTDTATTDANIVPVSMVIQTEGTKSSADEANEDFTTENMLDLNHQLTTTILETANEFAASEKHETISPTNAPETNVNIHENVTEYLPVETVTTKSTSTENYEMMTDDAIFTKYISPQVDVDEFEKQSTAVLWTGEAVETKITDLHEYPETLITESQTIFKGDADDEIASETTEQINLPTVADIEVETTTQSVVEDSFMQFETTPFIEPFKNVHSTKYITAEITDVPESGEEQNFHLTTEIVETSTEKQWTTSLKPDEVEYTTDVVMITTNVENADRIQWNLAIGNIEWDDALTDKSSWQFRKVSNEIQSGLLNILNTIIPEKVSEIKVTNIEPEHLNIQGDAVFVNRTEPILSLLEKFIANLKKNGNQIGDYSVDPMTIAFNGTDDCFQRVCNSEKISSELRQTMSEFKEPEEKPLLPTYVIVIIACVLAIAALLTLAVLVKRYRSRSGSEVFNKSIKNGSAVKAWAAHATPTMQYAQRNSFDHPNLYEMKEASGPFPSHINYGFPNDVKANGIKNGQRQIEIALQDTVDSPKCCR